MEIHWIESELEQTVAVLDRINPHGYTAEGIRAETLRHIDERPDLMHWGTAGFYVTLFRQPDDPEVRMARVSLMPFAVLTYLEERDRIDREIQTRVSRLELAEIQSRYSVTEEAARQVLDGNCRALTDAFMWGSTPQGAHHWVARAVGHVPLDESDRAFIRSLVGLEVET